MDALLTSAHCAYTSDDTKPFYNNSNWMGSVVMGSSTTHNTLRDIALIQGDSFSGYGTSTYVGGYNSSSLLLTTASLTPTVGLYVCFGGAMSGERCSAQILDNNKFEGGVGPLFTAQRTSGALSAEGDSGGPVYTYHYASSGTYLRPVGIVTGSYPDNYPASCSGAATVNCSRRSVSAQITTAQGPMAFDILASSED